jgi:structural maintenance of chromosome 2
MWTIIAIKGFTNNTIVCYKRKELFKMVKNLLNLDKKTLISNMHELDEKRTKTLEKCFADVKINLSSIFNDLLPGATAHLNLIDPYDVTKGA